MNTKGGGCVRDIVALLIISYMLIEKVRKLTSPSSYMENEIVPVDFATSGLNTNNEISTSLRILFTVNSKELALATTMSLIEKGST